MAVALEVVQPEIERRPPLDGVQAPDSFGRERECGGQLLGLAEGVGEVLARRDQKLVGRTPGRGDRERDGSTPELSLGEEKSRRKLGRAGRKVRNRRG